MGMERSIPFAGSAPSWLALREKLAVSGLAVQLRMIDGQPAFPDESPEDGWRELRLSTSGGMLTLRLQPGSLSVIVWGNAGPDLLGEWEKVVQACSAAVGA